MSRNESIPFRPRVQDALEKAATRKGSGLTRVDRTALPILGEAFRETPVVSLAALLARLWPRADRRTALNRFHQLKRRFNNARAGVVICSPSDNRDPEAKEVWFEADQSPVERAVAEVRASPEPDKPHYTPERFYPGLQARTYSPLLTFPSDVTAFCETELATHWDRFTPEAREFLCSLTTRFMPMVQLLPHAPTPRVQGFELLASGPRGELYGGLFRACRTLDVPIEILDTILMLVQVLSVLELMRRARPAVGQTDVFFSLNISPPLLADRARLARAVIERFDRGEREHLRFELIEKVRQPQLEPIKLLLAEFPDLRIGLDDVNDHHLLTAARLGQFAGFTKVSHEYVQEALRTRDELPPKEFLEKLLKHALPGKPLVLEGVEELPVIQSIIAAGAEAGLDTAGYEVFGQGFGCPLDSVWEPYMGVPAGMGWRGQFALPLDERGFEGRSSSSASPETEREFLSAIEDGIRSAGHQVVERAEIPAGCEIHRLTVDSGQQVWAHYGRTVPSAECFPASGSVIVPDTRLDRILSQLHEASGSSSRAEGRKRASQLLALGTFVSRQRQTPEPSEAPPRPDSGLWRFDPALYYAERGRLERQSCAPALELLHNWVAEPAVPLAYLLGETGSGKTFLARMLCRGLRERGRSSAHRMRVPLYIDLRDVPEAVARAGSLEDVLRSGAQHVSLAEEEWRHVVLALQEGRLLLVLDGLDEKSVHLAERGAIQRFRRILHSAARGDAKVLIVTRETVFADAASMLRELRGEETSAAPRERSHDARILEVLPLESQALPGFFACFLSPEETRSTEELLSRARDISALAPRPLMARMIAEGRQEIAREAADVVERGVAETYGRFVAEWLARDEEKSVLVTDIKLAVLEALALEMFTTGRHCVSLARLREAVISEVSAFYRGVPPVDPARSGVEDIRMASLLTRDEAGDCRFVHSALQDYFLARRLAARLGEKLELPELTPGAASFLVSLSDRPQLEATLARLSKGKSAPAAAHLLRSELQRRRGPGTRA